MSKTYCTIPTGELGSVDFAQTSMTNALSVPRNLTGDSALIKWQGDMPASLNSITGKSETMTQAQATALLRSAEWAEVL